MLKTIFDHKHFHAVFERAFFLSLIEGIVRRSSGRFPVDMVVFKLVQTCFFLRSLSISSIRFFFFENKFFSESISFEENRPDVQISASPLLCVQLQKQLDRLQQGLDTSWGH